MVIALELVLQNTKNILQFENLFNYSIVKIEHNHCKNLSLIFLGILESFEINSMCINTSIDSIDLIRVLRLSLLYKFYNIILPFVVNRMFELLLEFVPRVPLFVVI